MKILGSFIWLLLSLPILALVVIEIILELCIVGFGVITEWYYGWGEGLRK